MKTLDKNGNVLSLNDTVFFNFKKGKIIFITEESETFGSNNTLDLSFDEDGVVVGVSSFLVEKSLVEEHD